MHREFRLALLMALAAALSAAVYAQAPPGPLPPRPGVPPQAPRSEAQIRVRVDLVTTPVTVRDSSGELLFDVAETEFRIFDNGVEQKLERFDMGGVPLSVVIVLETSSRVEPMHDALRRTGIVFTQTVLGETGEAAVLAVDDSLEELVPFTSDHDRIEAAMQRFRVGTSGLRLHDALARAVEMLTTRADDRRRVIVVVAEATDTGSEAPLGEVLRQAQLANTTIYSVGLSTLAATLRSEPKPARPHSPAPEGVVVRPGMPGSVQTPGTEALHHGNINVLALAKILVEKGTSTLTENSLEVATAATGGMHKGSFRDSSIERAIAEIGGELHSQYLLSYRPAGVELPGYHEIEVRVRRPHLRVRARPGYYLPSDGGTYQRNE